MTRQRWWRGLAVRGADPLRNGLPVRAAWAKRLLLAASLLSRLTPSWQWTRVVQPQYTENSMPNPLDSLLGTVILGVIATFALYHVAKWLMVG